MYFVILTGGKNSPETFYKLQHPLIVKNFRKTGIEGKLLNIKKDIYQKPKGTIILNGTNLLFSPNIG